MVIGIVIALVIFLGADIGLQLVIPGRSASPVLDGGLLTLIGAIVTGAARSQKGAAKQDPPPGETPSHPAAPADVSPAADPPPSPDTGRHRKPEAS